MRPRPSPSGSWLRSPGPSADPPGRRRAGAARRAGRGPGAGYPGLPCAGSSPSSVGPRRGRRRPPDRSSKAWTPRSMRWRGRPVRPGPGDPGPAGRGGRPPGGHRRPAAGHRRGRLSARRAGVGGRRRRGHPGGRHSRRRCAPSRPAWMPIRAPGRPRRWRRSRGPPEGRRVGPRPRPGPRRPGDRRPARRRRIRRRGAAGRRFPASGGRIRQPGGRRRPRRLLGHPARAVVARPARGEGPGLRRPPCAGLGPRPRPRDIGGGRPARPAAPRTPFSPPWPCGPPR